MNGQSFTHQLDAKNRMRIPAKLREQLGPNYSVSVGTGGCLYVYTKEQTDALIEKLGKVNAFDPKQLKASRYVLYNTWTAVEDKQGRILLPENLRAHAKLSKNIITVQGPRFIEIWSEEVWTEYFNSVDLADISSVVE
jgi:MraZ protein